MKDNKKTIVLAILGLALVAVGAFQFIPKGGGATPVAVNAPKKAATKPGTTATNNGTPNATGANSQSAGNEAGATTSSTGTSENGNVAVQETDPQKAILLQMVSKPYPARDPFTPQSKVDPNAPTTTAPTPPTTTAPVARQPVASNSTRRPPPLGGGYKPWEALPSGTGVGASSNPAATGPILSKGAPLRQPDEFAYTLKGVLVGSHPMAVFEDDSGNQRLVPLGGSLDGDSKVVGIEKGKVRIRHRGKDQTHTLPEGP
jgi:hypothetical protein